ncbi:hypothetical protein BGZ83_005463 [Gryganskiella cystojenkinii]|nr:hypothetical protein BGZ83_005463 [Gryganskiella cystojenkinii]
MSAQTIVANAGAFTNTKDEAPVHTTLNIDIPATARSALAKANTISPPLTPPLLSTSASSSVSFDALPTAFDIDAISAEAAAVDLPKEAIAEAGAVAVAGGATDARSRALSRQFFFPNQTRFECVVPTITRARDLNLKDHPIIEGQFAEYEKLYHADSLMTVDGRPMVRLL